MLNKFPPPPTVLSLLWQKFRTAPATFGETEGVRANWHKGRKRYAVWVVRVQVPEVVQRVEKVGSTLAQWLFPQRPKDLHITLGIAGFPTTKCSYDDDVDEASIRLAALQLSELNLPLPLRFCVHGACAFLSAPFLAVSGHANTFERLRGIVDLPGRSLTMNDYVPHVTIGRWNGVHPTKVLADVLERFVDLPAIAVNAKAVELVEFATDDPFATLVTRITIPLAAG